MGSNVHFLKNSFHVEKFLQHEMLVWMCVQSNVMVDSKIADWPWTDFCLVQLCCKQAENAESISGSQSETNITVLVKTVFRLGKLNWLVNSLHNWILNKLKSNHRYGDGRYFLLLASGEEEEKVCWVQMLPNSCLSFSAHSSSVHWGGRD